MGVLLPSAGGQKSKQKKDETDSRRTFHKDPSRYIFIIILLYRISKIEPGCKTLAKFRQDVQKKGRKPTVFARVFVIFAQNSVAEQSGVQKIAYAGEDLVLVQARLLNVEQ